VLEQEALSTEKDAVLKINKKVNKINNLYCPQNGIWKNTRKHSKYLQCMTWLNPTRYSYTRKQI